MKLEEQYAGTRDEARMIVQREEVLIDRLKGKEFSVAGKYSVDSVGKYATRIWIYPVDPKNVKTLARELGEVFPGVVWELDFQDKNGTFRYIARQKDYWGKEESFLIIVENVPTPLNCKVTKKMTMEKVTRYKKKCDKEGIDV